MNLFCFSNSKGQNVADGQQGSIKIPVVPDVLKAKCVRHLGKR